MKILFLTDNFPPEVNAPATRTYEHCRQWVKMGAEVTVITSFPNFPEGKVYKGYKNQLKNDEWMDGIKVIHVWTYITANKGFVKRTLDYCSFSITSFLVGIFVKTDIIIATSPQFFTALAGRTLSFCKHRPWIMEVRDLWPESIVTVGALKNNIILRYFEKEEKWSYRSAKKIIVVTNSFKEKIILKGIPEEKIEVILNGANSDLYKPKEKNNSLISELGLEGKFILGYVGTHGMAHKLDFVLDCAKKLRNTKPNYHFLFIGNGAEKDALLEKVYSENLTNVTMMDSVTKDEVPGYLSILDASIINLRKCELFKTVIPSKIFESAAMQIPILIGVDGEARGIVEEFNAGLFYEPENMTSFLSQLDQITKKENIENLKKGCKKLAEAFDRKKLAGEMFDLISRIINDRVSLHPRFDKVRKN